MFQILFFKIIISIHIISQWSTLSNFEWKLVIFSRPIDIYSKINQVKSRRYNYSGENIPFNRWTHSSTHPSPAAPRVDLSR